MYFQSSLVIRCGMQTRLNCQSSYFTEQWWIFTRLCTPTKFYRQVQPAFWRYLRNDSLSNSFITFTHGHPLIQNNGPASREKKKLRHLVLFHGRWTIPLRHTRERGFSIGLTFLDPTSRNKEANYHRGPRSSLKMWYYWSGCPWLILITTVNMRHETQSGTSICSPIFFSINLHFNLSNILNTCLIIFWL